LFTENGVMIDFQELQKVIDTCDVFTVGFRMFPERMIVDTRHNDTDGPMVEVVDPVATVEERFFWLGQRRPTFGVPQQFSFFVWPYSVRYFDESGLGEMVRRRVYAEDETGEVGRHMAASMVRLHTLEQRATFDAIHGRNYHTLWDPEQADESA
jgi:hypothetical protein